MKINSLLAAAVISATLITAACSEEKSEAPAGPTVEKADSAPAANAPPIQVTRDNFQYAEAIRNAENYVKLGGENKWGHFRDLSPVGSTAPTIRMNLDTLYSVAVLDNTDNSIELTIPEGDILQTILVLDDQAYSKHYFEEPGVHKIDSDSPFVILIARIGVKDRYSQADLEKARKAQDNFTIAGQGDKPFTPTQYDRDSLEAMTADLNQEFLAGDGVLVYGQMKDDVDEHKRLLSNAAGWGGMHDNINTYTSSETMSGDVCRTVDFEDPHVGEFFSFTLYDDDGYLMDGNTSINSYNMAKNEDGGYTVSFNCGESAVNNITSTGREFNYIVRAYAASEIVRSGEWIPVSPTVVK